jgi:outer membrane biosynthesis protein TonB
MQQRAAPPRPAALEVSGDLTGDLTGELPESSVTENSLRRAVPTPPRSNRARLWVFGAVATTLVGLAAAWVLTRGPSTVEVQVRRKPATARVVVDGAEVGLGGLVLSPGIHEASASAPGYEPWRQSFTLTSGAAFTLEVRMEPVSAEAEAPRAATFSVRFTGEADAELTVDGVPRGVLPVTVELEAGTRHRYSAEKTGRETALGTVEGKPGETVEVAVTLGRPPETPEPRPRAEKPAPARPAAPRPPAPQPEPPPRAEPPAPKARPVAAEAPVAPPPPRPTPPAVAASGTFICSSRPAGAQVWVDGRNTGAVTPVPKAKALSLSAGSHTVVFKSADGTQQSDPQQVTITEGQETKLLNVELKEQ